MNYILILVMFLLAVPTAALAVDTGFDIPEEYLKRVEDGIERYRKSDASIRVVDSEGRPVKNAVVEVRQLSHDFLFGCAFPSWNVAKEQPSPEVWHSFEKYFLSLFNYTTTENMLKWVPLEKEEGKPDFTLADAFVDWCRKNRITIKGHCLVWGWEKHSAPGWLGKYSQQEVNDRVHRHVTEVVSRYKGKIDIWDVVNEPLHCHWFETAMSPDYAVKALKWAREANPRAKLLVNEFGCHIGDADRFARYCKDLIDAGAPLNAIGEQAHDSPTLYSPKNIFDTLDKLAEVGLDIHLTEITQPSNDSDIRSDFIQGKWTPEMQGKYYRYYYTLAFSHPKVKAITMWALWDGSTWLPGGGIIAKDFTPKPAYNELNSMINREWRTNLTGKTGADGTYRFRGFHGNYEVKVTSAGKTETVKMHLAEGGKNAITLGK